MPSSGAFWRIRRQPRAALLDKEEPSELREGEVRPVPDRPAPKGMIYEGPYYGQVLSVSYVCWGTNLRYPT